MIVAGVVIALLILFLVGNAVGIFKGSGMRPSLSRRRSKCLMSGHDSRRSYKELKSMILESM